MVRYILIAIVVLLILRILLRRKQPPPMIEEIQRLDASDKTRPSIGTQSEGRDPADRLREADQSEHGKREDG